MMNRKTVLLLAVAFATGSLAGFLAGKLSKSTETVESFAALLNEYHGNLQHLERELAKKMGIEVSANNQQAPTTDDALVKAEALLKQGDLAKAALYFSRSLSQNPGTWEKIHRYQHSFLDYCRQLRDNGEYDIALNVLAEMETFLLNQTLYLTVPNIEKLDQALSEITELRQEIMDALTTKNVSETRQLMNILLVDELGTPSTTEPQQLTQHIDELKVNVSALQSLDTNFLNEADLFEIARKITQLETGIVTFEEHLVTAQYAATVSILVQRAEQFIAKAENEPPQSELILYYLNAAESVIRQLVLLAPEAEMATVQMARLSQSLEHTKQVIAQRQSQAIFTKIEREFNKLRFAKNTKAQKAIDQLIVFKQRLNKQASRLSSLEFLEQAQVLMEKVNRQIVEWQEKQQRRYEQWAVEMIVHFYEIHKNELGVGTDEERIYEGIIEYLGNIDTRYLATSASTAYNEAFNTFYAELSHYLKIPLSAKMTVTEKKPLSDF